VAVLETVARGTWGSEASVPVSTLLDEEAEAVVVASGPFSGADTAWTAAEVAAVCDGAETVEAVDRSERAGRHST
jgi:hypothetical protein